MKLVDFLINCVEALMPQRIVNILRGLEAEGERRGKLLEITKQLKDSELKAEQALPGMDLHKEVPRRTDYSEDVPIVDKDRELKSYLNSVQELLAKLFSESNINVEFEIYDTPNNNYNRNINYRPNLIIQTDGKISDLAIRKFEAAAGYGLSDSSNGTLKFAGQSKVAYDSGQSHSYYIDISFKEVEETAAKIYTNLRSKRAELIKLAAEISKPVKLETSNPYVIDAETAALLDSRQASAVAVTPRAVGNRALE